MIKKYHYNEEDGTKGICRAHIRDCPVSPAQLHASTEEELMVLIEDHLQKVENLSLIPEPEPTEREKKIAHLSRVFPSSIDTLLTDEEEEAVKKEIEELTENKDHAGLKALVERRSNTEEFKDAVEEFEERRKKFAEMKAITDDDELTDKEYVKLHGESALEKREHLTYEQRFELKKAITEEAEWIEAVRQELNNYRQYTALAALRSSDLRAEEEIANGTHIVYSGDKMGDMRNVGFNEIGSPEWHQDRAAGIGGSDVGKIMAMNRPEEKDKYSAKAFNEMIYLKAGLERAEDGEHVRFDLTTPIGRGEAMEDYIHQMYADNNPDQIVANCKDSWAGTENDYARANFDGLILDKNGTPEGVIEIKTSSNPDDWGDPEEGLNGVPKGYERQVLWYASNSDLKHGAVVALINDSDYREYKFNMDDPEVKEKVADIQRETKDFWEQEVMPVRMGKKKAPYYDKQVKKGYVGFADKDKGLTSSNKKSITSFYSRYAGVSEEEAKKAVNGALKGVVASREPERVTKRLTKLFRDVDPFDRGKPVVGLDIETTSVDADRSRVLETGIVEFDANGKSKVIYDQLHGIPESAKRSYGTGVEEVHGISLDMVEGKPDFYDPKVQKDILGKLSGKIVLSHNASYERKFLRRNLKGFAEAEDRGDVQFMDSMDLTKRLMPGAKDSKLETFVRGTGIKYEGEHRATKDTAMMTEGFRRFVKEFREKGAFELKSPTDSLDGYDRGKITQWSEKDK